MQELYEHTWLYHFLELEVLSNKVQNYLWCIFVILGLFLLKKFLSQTVSRIVYAFIKKQSNNLPVKYFLDYLASPLELFTAAVLVYTAFTFLRWPTVWNLDPVSEFGVRMVVLKTYQIFITASICWVFVGVVNFISLVVAERKRQKNEDQQLVNFMRELFKVFLWVFYFFFVLGAIFKLDVASIITGLGIGGLAVALAAKETLENLIASFTIFLDKPFAVGDVVKIEGSVEGEIERIGFRSTRIRSFDKSFITIPNRLMVDKPVDNLTQREYRRAKFKILIEHNTANYKIEKAKAEIEKYINTYHLSNGNGKIVFDNFGVIGIELMIYYYLRTREWEDFIHEKDIMNLEIKRIIENNDIKIAYIKDPHYSE